MRNVKYTLVLFVLAILMLGCSKNDSSAESNNTSDYLYYVSGKINGSPFVYGQLKNATALDYQLVYNLPLEGATCAYSNDQGLNLGINYGTSVYPDFDKEDTSPTIDFNFVRFYFCSNPKSSNEIFNDLFPIDSYLFSQNDDSSGEARQIGIKYVPITSENKVYSSYGVDQSNSNFKITSSEEGNTSLSGQVYEYGQNIEGEFSVKLVNEEDSSDFIEITEGRFKISIGK